MAAARWALLALALWALRAAAEEEGRAATTTTTTGPAGRGTPTVGRKSSGSPQEVAPGVAPGPTAASEALPPPPPPPPPSGFGLPALHRALYVLAGLAGIGLLYYLGGRALRTRKPPRKKYGLLSNSEDHMEMGSVESDEETVFETRRLRR